MSNMKYAELKDLATQPPNSPTKHQLAIQFRAWAAIGQKELQSMTFVGKMAESQPTEASPLIGEQEYWSPSAKIIPDQYPYADCDIYRLDESNDYFLIYQELGGHAPELRCRYFDPDLLA